MNDILDELADDEAAMASRRAFCEATANALRRVGHVLWLTGYVVGSDRATGESPFGFGDDRAVGVATVAQIGGELSAGAIEMLKADNRYSANALIRQIVEVEYLAHAFATQSETATSWLRSNREERRSFWSPAKLRERSDGVFLAPDYWEHCERGGHPTTAGMMLLPGHAGANAQFLWTDLAGHLAGVWENVKKVTEELLDGSIPSHWQMPDVEAARVEWLASDGLHAALTDLARRLRESD